MQLPVGLNASEMAMAAVRTGSIGVFILLFGRVLRRAKGIGAYLWLFGGFLTFLGVAVASGVFDVDVARVLELARIARKVARWGGSALAPALVSAVVPVRVARTSRVDGRAGGRTQICAYTDVRMVSREVARAAADARQYGHASPYRRVRTGTSAGSQEPASPDTRD